MLRTLKISLALRNAHHANALIYALAHTPLIRRLLPAAPYGAHTPKALANVLGALGNWPRRSRARRCTF